MTDTSGTDGDAQPVTLLGTADEVNGGMSLDQSSESGPLDHVAEAEPPVAKPARRAARKPAKGRGRKAPARKAAVRRSTATAKQAIFPRHAVERALRIPKAIIDQNAGRPTSVADAAKYATGGSANGAFRTEVSSAKKYGFLKSDNGVLTPQDRARRILYPQSENDRINGLREAVLDAPNIAEVYSHYRGENLPDREFFTNALRDNFKIPAEKIQEFLAVFDESMRSAQLVDASGERQRLIDVGRDERVPGAVAAAPPKVSVASGTTCFVMQPFGGHLGTYYEAIFKPAIEQAELTAVRADDDIFATGNIMDQVWRGILHAKVLVAELTSKNPNVLYELGLAHALEKPVILVSSNEEDVPFDLRHIRTILYDKNDPFWGQKLIDKIADNIRSALSNPEEAIFQWRARANR
ncbi:hypothetical protein ACFO6V_28200 [Promicromonospora alba]|uniref:Nucleoside 2-deoxyribosyltransferase-like protein n=1 Tax=Promicromonospora alba TaxID=1616110 RepID=A0ABV9HQN6_9MICO